MSDIEFDKVVNLALQLTPVEQARLMERLAAEIRDVLVEAPSEEVAPWTDEEIAAMIDIQPMTGAEIVAAGLTGGWADMGIEDGAAWVNEQKRKRRENRRWL